MVRALFTSRAQLLINLYDIKNFSLKKILEALRINPGWAGWEAGALPLSYANPQQVLILNYIYSKILAHSNIVVYKYFGNK